MRSKIQKYKYFLCYWDQACKIFRERGLLAEGAQFMMMSIDYNIQEVRNQDFFVFWSGAGLKWLLCLMLLSLNINFWYSLFFLSDLSPIFTLPCQSLRHSLFLVTLDWCDPCVWRWTSCHWSFMSRLSLQWKKLSAIMPEQNESHGGGRELCMRHLIIICC